MSVLRRVLYKRLFVPKFNPKAATNGFATDSNSSGFITTPDTAEIPKCSLNEYVFQNVHLWENRIATECAVTGRNYTYSQLRTKSKNFGAALRKKFKLEKNDTIAILLPNVPEFPIVTLGAIRAGLICTTVNPIYTADEISRQLLDSSTKVIVTLNELWPLADAATKQAKKNIPIITIKSQQSQNVPSGAANFAELADYNADLPSEESWDSVAFLPYSSGTTGLPKGVMLTHHNIVANVAQIGHPKLLISKQTTPDHQDIVPAVLPMFHIYGLTILSMFQIKLGVKIVTLPKFTPELYIGTLKKYKPNVLYLAPPIAIFLGKVPQVQAEDFKPVRAVVNGAAPLGQLDGIRLTEKANKDLPILQGYGLTETSPAVITTRPAEYNKESAKGSIGRPVPNTTLKIVNPEDPSGTPLGPNELGELLVKGPQVMKGYLNRPEENIFVDGWMRTGDMMYYNDDGFLFIKDRLKELIKVKGFQVAPAELEEIIRDFPDVLDAAVIGIPHDLEGEIPRAYIVAKPNAKIDVDQLKNHVHAKVAPYKQLKGGISIVDSIPKNASGKTLRRELKQMYEEELK
ncbi:uncharacterized protein [Diabrotica undecimpunctata]|uniref:uncharacterized protein isoform X1 n=1 Tax=Diabrotica undecimpunctata TaxID=50387 RepID=UPI003B63B8C3